MFNFFRFGCFIFCFCASDEALGSNLSNRLGEELKTAFKWRYVILRGSIHQNPMTYYRHEGNEYFYAHSRINPKLFRTERDEPVQIRRVRVRDGVVVLKLISGRLGKGAVFFSSPSHSSPIDRAAFDAGFALCFKTGEETARLPSLIGNTRSKMFHVDSCNHLPDSDKQRVFYTKAEAEGAGMQACKLCFTRLPLLSDSETERTMKPLSTDLALNARARKVGQRVLDNWPVPLQGDQFRFSVVDDYGIDAYALPTGIVFVSRGLLEVAESDLEIEGMIAHEIAHVERRHSDRINRNARRKRAAAARDAFLDGYPRSMEEEADVMAALYLERQYGREGLAEMTRVLKKMRYYAHYEQADPKDPQAFRSHPLLDHRIAAFNVSQVKAFEKPVRVVGRNRRGYEVVTLELSCQRQTPAAVGRRFSLAPTQVLGKIYIADIGEPRNFRGVILTTEEAMKIRLGNEERPLIGPNEERSFLLQGNLPWTLDTLDLREALVALDVRETTFRLPGEGLTWHVVKE